MQLEDFIRAVMRLMPYSNEELADAYIEGDFLILSIAPSAGGEFPIRIRNGDHQ